MRRRAKAAFTVRNSISSSFTRTAFSPRTGRITKVLSTLGGGVKHSAGTSITRRGSHRYWQRTASGPHPSSPGADRILSATSFCTIRASRLTGSPEDSSRWISGVVI